MVGRPSKVIDEQLSNRLVERMTELGLQASEVSRLLRLSQATISRAITKHAFSSTTKKAVELWLDGKLTPSFPAFDRSHALRILREFDTMVPAIRSALSVVLDDDRAGSDERQT